MIYFIVLFLLLILTVRYDINGKEKYRDQWYNAVLIILILIAGLRFRLGEDTINYLYMFYHETPDLLDFDVDIILSGKQPPLWFLLNSIVKTFGGRFFIIQLIHAAILNTLMLKYFKKHSIYPFACTTLYFLWRYQWFSMVIMKASIALSIILFANDYFLEKKYVKGFILVLLATGFHQSSLLFMIVPFLTFLRFNRVGIVLLIASYFMGVFIQSKLGDVFTLFEIADGVSNKLDAYMDGGYMAQHANIKYFIVNVFPIIFYSILSIAFLKRNCKNAHILSLEPFLMITLLFQMMQFNINMMYRYIYAFTPYFILFFVHFLMEYSKNSKILEKSLSYVRSVTILFPLFVSIAYAWPLIQPNFYPYSTVIERSIDDNRERYYMGFLFYYNLDVNEY